jgi:hypothetical protein
VLHGTVKRDREVVALVAEVLTIQQERREHPVFLATMAEIPLILVEVAVVVLVQLVVIM